jgi:hypothetical protein
MTCFATDPGRFLYGSDPAFDFDTDLDRTVVQKLSIILPTHHWYWCSRRIFVPSEVVFSGSFK